MECYQNTRSGFAAGEEMYLQMISLCKTVIMISHLILTLESQMIHLGKMILPEILEEMTLGKQLF